jgi:hypothetical protein
MMSILAGQEQRTLRRSVFGRLAERFSCALGLETIPPQIAAGTDCHERAKQRIRSRNLAAHIKGSLYYEQMGRSGPIMAFVHPNPMDQSCWMYQMAHLYTAASVSIGQVAVRQKPSLA